MYLELSQYSSYLLTFQGHKRIVLFRAYEEMLQEYLYLQNKIKPKGQFDNNHSKKYHVELKNQNNFVDSIKYH